MDEVKNRLNQALKYLKASSIIDTFKSLGNELEIKPQNLNGMLRGGTRPRQDLLDLLQNKYGISKEWIQKGKGQMLIKPDLEASTEVPPIVAVSDLWKDKYIVSLEEQREDRKTIMQTAQAAMQAADAATELAKGVAIVHALKNNVEVDHATLLGFQEFVIEHLSVIEKKTKRDLRLDMGKIVQAQMKKSDIRADAHI